MIAHNQWAEPGLVLPTAAVADLVNFEVGVVLLAGCNLPLGQAAGSMPVTDDHPTPLHNTLERGVNGHKNHLLSHRMHFPNSLEPPDPPFPQF